METLAVNLVAPALLAKHAVPSMVDAGGGSILAYDGARFRVWAGVPDGPWRQVATPTRPRASGDTLLSVVGDDTSILLLSDDGTSGRVWVAGWNTLSR